MSHEMTNPKSDTPCLPECRIDAYFEHPHANACPNAEAGKVRVAECGCPVGGSAGLVIHNKFCKPTPAPVSKVEECNPCRCREWDSFELCQCRCHFPKPAPAPELPEAPKVEELKAGLPAREDVVITLTVRAERAERALGDAEARVKELEAAGNRVVKHRNRHYRDVRDSVDTLERVLATRKEGESR